MDNPFEPSFPSNMVVSMDMVETSHNSSSTPDPPSSEDSGSSGILLSLESASGLKPTAKRSIRSHRKTRQGCFNCKRRKVKCSEERPSCVPCNRNGLRCVYPLTREAVASPYLSQLSVPQTQSMRELHSGNLEYTALDMRLMHHFIIEAYPHLPLNCDRVWTREIPAMAYQYRYLMHAMLSVSASHLMRKGEHDLAPAAYFHRLKAIEGVNEALDRSDRTSDDNDALISACYSLAFQNAHIGDSQAGFWITVRSIASIGHELKNSHHDTRFKAGITPQGHAAVMTSRLEHLPRVRPDLVQEALASLEALCPFCKDHVQREFYDLMHNTLTSLFRSSLEGYFSFAAIYAFIATMDATSFARLSDTKEYTLQMLQCEFLAIQTMLVPILGHEWTGRGPPPDSSPQTESHKDTSSARWSETVCKLKSVSPLRKYLDWADGIQNRAEAGTLWLDYFEDKTDEQQHQQQQQQPGSAADGPDTRAAKKAWTDKLGLGESSAGTRDVETAVKEYEERIMAFDRRVDARRRGVPEEEVVLREPIPIPEVSGEPDPFVFYNASS